MKVKSPCKNKCELDLSKEYCISCQRTTKEIENCRWQICKTCQLYDPEQHRCRECGCYIQNKLEWSGSHCPLNFW